METPTNSEITNPQNIEIAPEATNVSTEILRNNQARRNNSGSRSYVQYVVGGVAFVATVIYL